MVERKINLLVDVRHHRRRTFRSVDGYEFGNVGVGDSDEITAGRIERVQKQSGLTGQRPTVSARKNLFASVGKALEESEILQLVAPAVQRFEQLGLVRLEPSHCLVEGIDLLNGMHFGIGHDPH